MSSHRNIVLSIVVPIYNGAAYIDSLVKIVEDQKFSSMELILVDDGSTDDSYQLCQRQAEQYDWIQAIHTENHGVSHARNTGLAAAKGEWIQFLDVDDVISPAMANAFYNITKTEDVDVIVCGCNRIRGIGDAVKCGPKDNAILSGEDSIRLFDQLKMDDRYWLLDYVWNKWFKRTIIEKFQIRFDETLSLGEDFVFNATYMRYMKGIALVKDAYYQYRVGDEGLVSRFQKTPWVGRMHLYQAQKELYQFLGLWEANEYAIHCAYGQIAFGDMRMINSRKCTFTKKEKQQFLDSMIDSPLFEMILAYLQSRTSPVFKLYHKVCNTKKSGMILGLIQIENIKNKVDALRDSYHEKKDKNIKKNRIPVIKANKEKLRTDRFTIISQNCIGGVFYHDMEKEFLSPTVNLFIPAADFVKFVSRLEHYLALEPVMYQEKEYPVGILGDVELHFYHYSSCIEAKTAWERRKKRVDLDKVVVVCTDRDGFDDTVYRNWCDLPYKKVLFTANETYGKHADAVYISEFKKAGCVQNELIEKRWFYREDKLMNLVNSFE